LFGRDNTVTVDSGTLNVASSLLGNTNTVTITAGGTLDGARNWLGNNNTVSTGGGLQNTVTNIGGAGNQLTATGSNSNNGLNLFGNTNILQAGSVGANGNLALTFGGTGNTVTGGASSGNRTAGFGIFGSGNTVTAGPGPFALAGSILQTNQTVTQVGTGIAINQNRIGGAAALNTRQSAARKAPSTSARKSVTARTTAK